MTLFKTKVLFFTTIFIFLGSFSLVVPVENSRPSGSCDRSGCRPFNRKIRHCLCVMVSLASGKQISNDFLFSILSRLIENKNTRISLFNWFDAILSYTIHSSSDGVMSGKTFRQTFFVSSLFSNKLIVSYSFSSNSRIEPLDRKSWYISYFLLQLLSLE